MSRKSSARTDGPRSMGLPEPLKTRPSMSSETGVRRMSPVNSHTVFLASIPDVPSNTCVDVTIDHPRLGENSLSLSLSLSAGSVYLNDGFAAADFEDLPRPDGAVGQPQVDDLGVLGELDVVQDHQRSVHARHRPVRCGPSPFFGQSNGCGN